MGYILTKTNYILTKTKYIYTLSESFQLNIYIIKCIYSLLM